MALFLVVLHLAQSESLSVSAVVRAVQMTWQNCPLNLDENLAVPIVNLLHEAVTNGIVKRAMVGDTTRVTALRIQDIQQ